MRFFLISLLLLTFGANALAQDEWKKAYDLYRRGSYQDALVLLDEAVQTRPDWWYPILLKGLCNQKLDKHEEAMRNFNDALTLEVPTNDIPKIKNAMAQTYMAMKDYKKASQAYTELLGQAPASRKFDLYFSRGQCEMQIAKDSEDSNVGNAKSYFSKAVVSFSEALKQETKRTDLMIEASFQKAYAQYKIGNLTGGIKSLEDSIRAFQDVITRNPKEQRAHQFIINLQLSIVDESKGNDKIKAYDKLVSYIDRYLNIWPKDDDMLTKKGLALQGAKKYKEAINVFDLVLRSRPNDSEVYFSMGSCQMADKQFKSAVSSLEKALSKGKKDAQVYSFIANCYAKQKTKCYGTDIPLEKKAIEILNRGVKEMSGQSKAALQKELSRKEDNLNILQENLATDNQNHKNTVDNIKEISKAIGINTAKLQRNREMYIQQPTEELKVAIDDGQKTLDSDKASLAKEYKTLQGYINEIKKCGDTESFTHYSEMTTLLKNRQ